MSTIPSSIRSSVESRNAPNRVPLPDDARVAAVERVHHRADDEGDAAEEEVLLPDQHGRRQVADQADHRDRVRASGATRSGGCARPPRARRRARPARPARGGSRSHRGRPRTSMRPGARAGRSRPKAQSGLSAREQHRDAGRQRRREQAEEPRRARSGCRSPRRRRSSGADRRSSSTFSARGAHQQGERDQAKIMASPTCIEGTAANGLKSASPALTSTGSLPVTALEGSSPSSVEEARRGRRVERSSRAARSPSPRAPCCGRSRSSRASRSRSPAGRDSCP